MKKILIFIIAAFLLIATAAVVKSAATVIINPSMPANGDSLTCSVSGSSGDFDFYWYKNGQEFRIDYGISSIIQSSDTNPGDKWKCVVYTPMGNNVKPIGEASVDFPIFPAGSVVISPSQPEDDDSLTCSVPSSTDRFEFYFYRNGVQFKNEQGTNSIINSADTTPGDNWRCSVWTVGGTSRVGDAVALIDPSSKGNVSLAPEKAFTDDTLSASVSTTGDYEYVWYKNGAQFKTEITDTSTINPSDTTKHDNWTVEVYTPVYNKYVGNASIEILNSAPEIDSINYPDSINAGDSLTISFTASDADGDDLYYYMFIERSGGNWNFIGDSNSVTLDTSSWRPGTYHFILFASDGENDGMDAERISIDVLGKGSGEVKIYNLDISALSIPGGNYLRIRNYAHSMENVMLKMTTMETGEMKTLSMDMARNTVKLIPLDFNFEPGKQYTLRIDVISDNFVGKDYVLVEV